MEDTDGGWARIWGNVRTSVRDSGVAYVCGAFLGSPTVTAGFEWIVERFGLLVGYGAWFRSWGPIVSGLVITVIFMTMPWRRPKMPISERIMADIDPEKLEHVPLTQSWIENELRGLGFPEDKVREQSAKCVTNLVQAGILHEDTARRFFNHAAARRDVERAYREDLSTIDRRVDPDGYCWWAAQYHLCPAEKRPEVLRALKNELRRVSVELGWK